MNLLDLVPEQLGRPVAWQPPAAQPLRGAYRKNFRLATLQRLAHAPGTTGPESLAIGPDNSLYSGFHDGRIVRFDMHGNMLKTVCNTGGRPLGLRFHPDGDLLVCDTQLGLLKVTLAGRVTVLVDRIDGKRFGFPDDLDVTRDGRHVYFTDASSKWGYERDHIDHIEHGGHGRLLHHDLKSGKTRVLMRGLCFANGVTLGPDEAYVLVVETGSYCVHRYWLKGDRAGTSDIFIDNLPGFPDNIRFNGRDRFWLAIPAKRNPILDALAPHPLLRFGLIQYARFLPLPISHTAMVLGVNLDGKPVTNLQDHGRRSYHFITQVLESGEYLYCSSLHQDTLARLPLFALEPSHG
ncbi:MAG: SMP-30/gluconolactonase/LRE family protein [Moraxellaceae bacterium]